jgi:hypothetical protein
MNPLEDRIKQFVHNPQEIAIVLYLIAVGHDKNDPVEQVIQTVMTHILLKFHDLPTKIGQDN